MKITKQLREQAIEVCDILASADWTVSCLPDRVCEALGYPPAVAAMCDVAWGKVVGMMSGAETNAEAAQLLREGLEPTAEDIKTDTRFKRTKFVEAVS